MVEIISSNYVPNPVAKKILENIKELVNENPIVARTYEYVAKFSKCSPENAEKALKELQEVGFSEFAAAMLINTVPTELEEAKALLGDIDGGYDEEKIEQALEVLRKYCQESE
ncbi:hypothetical protein PYJP_14780 [Pyrofollis japonicus]|uniref:hypothetical protein n=1 Tax=Pyrofollis japonicus TaxID=3060460 RepID=UPI00295BFA50|nr:hypothetical protein [Pyrofollis japonicus]BEP18126.1 hypothetical protein PYJP_14780 [Pyrofollis japonicus]